jgi:hypothetical protein
VLAKGFLLCQLTRSVSNFTYVAAPKKRDNGGVDVFRNETAGQTVTHDRTKSFVAWFDDTFFSENQNGDVVDCGIVIAEGEYTNPKLARQQPRFRKVQTDHNTKRASQPREGRIGLDLR